MSLTVRSLRDRVAAGITEAIGAGGWSESSFVFDLFPFDSRAISHLAFAVGIPSTTVAPLDRQNTRGGAADRAALATSPVIVRWSHTLRSDDQLVSYGEALDAEAVLIAAVLGVDRNPDLGIRLVRVASRMVDGEGTWFVGQLDFEAMHRLPLATT